MNNIILIFICFLAGILCRNWKRFPESTAQVLNGFVISISLPALILLYIPKLFDGSQKIENYWIPTVSIWAMFLFCWLVIHQIGKKLHWSNQKTGALILTTGLANTSFVGLPLLKALIGDEAIPYGLMADQPGSFLIVSTLGILIASLYGGQQIKLSNLLSRVFYFPPFISMLAAIPWAFLNLNSIPEIHLVLESLANTLVPLSLFSVGFSSFLSIKTLRRRMKPLLIGLTLRLIIAPAIFILIFYFCYYQHKVFPMAARVSVLEAAMATQITSAIVATEFKLDSELANLMVTLSIPASILTVTLWNNFQNFLYFL